MQRFKDLQVGARFVFASEHDPRFACSGMTRGPWVKRSARTYILDTELTDGERPFWTDHHNEVGSINVEVSTDLAAA